MALIIAIPVGIYSAVRQDTAGDYVGRSTRRYGGRGRRRPTSSSSGSWMPGCRSPGLLLLLTILSTFGRGVLQIIVILGISAGIGNARVVRSAVIGIKANPTSRRRAASAAR